MSAKFTNGEWKVNPTGPHWNNPEITNYGITYSEIGECVVDHVYELADAYLIAAAPEMYEMLESLDVYDGSTASVELQGKIDNLLAKARGEA